MPVLILGLVVFLGVHAMHLFAPGWRERMRMRRCAHPGSRRGRLDRLRMLAARATDRRQSVRLGRQAYVLLQCLPLPSRSFAMLAFLLWLVLLVFCWPLALLALVCYPIVWLLCLPLRLVGITVSAAFALLGALLMLPARVLRGRTA